MSTVPPRTLSDTTLQDIEPPPAPPQPSDPLLPAILIAAAVLVGLLAMARWRARAARARRRLRALHADLRRGQMDARASVVQAAACLRRAHDSPRIDRLAPRRPKDADSWARFVAELEQARFAPPPPSQDTAERLLGETRRWLGRPLVVTRERPPWTSARSS